MSKAKIIRALMEIYEPAYVRAGQTFKGFAFDGHRQAYAWWFVPFNGQPLFLGNSVSEALEIIQGIADSRE